MRATEVLVHNFRSIKDAEIELLPYSLLIGPNDAGKSNMIDAIRIFYEKDLKYDETRDFPLYATEDKEAWVELQYKPTSDELAQLRDDYRLPNDTFRIRKYFKSEELDDEGKPRSGIYAYVEGKLSGSRFYGAKNVQQGKLGDIIYVPAGSTLNEYTKLSGPSPLRDLVNAILKGILTGSKSYEELTKAFSSFGSGIKKEKTPEGRYLEGLEKEMSEEIAAWKRKFVLRINPIAPEEVLKNLVEPKVFDPDLEAELDPETFGEGFQRQLIFSLLKLAAQYETPKPPPTKKEFAPQLTWILFEEPEAFLHPPQIEVLDANLRAFSRDDSRQVLISSHSPQFSSKNVDDLPALVRLCREGVVTQIGQIRSADMPKLLEANQEFVKELELAGIRVEAADTQVDMESIKYALWLNPVRCCAFFAQRVLLVEGPTECALFGHLLRQGRLKLTDGDVFFLDTFGKWNIPRFIGLLGALRIPHAVLYDMDRNDSETRAVEKGIKSAWNEFTKASDFFDTNLETFLGIPPSREPHRKPQHVMWHYMNGKIATDRVDALCEKVKTLIESV